MFKIQNTTKEQTTKLDTQKGSGFLGRSITLNSKHLENPQARNCNLNTSVNFNNLIGLNMLKLEGTQVL